MCARNRVQVRGEHRARRSAPPDDLAFRSGIAGDSRIEHLARLELVWPKLAGGELSLDEVDHLLERSLRIFEAEDDWARGRALHCRAVVDGVYRLRYAELEAVIERLQLHYERSGFARGGALFLFASLAYRGPTPARDAIDRCNALLEDAATPFWQSFILPVLAVVESMDEQFDAARAHLVEARLARQELPEGGALATSWAGLGAEVELLAGISTARRRCSSTRAPPCEQLVSETGFRRTPHVWRRCATGRVDSKRRSSTPTRRWPRAAGSPDVTGDRKASARQSSRANR